MSGVLQNAYTDPIKLVAACWTVLLPTCSTDFITQCTHYLVFDILLVIVGHDAKFLFWPWL